MQLYKTKEYLVPYRKPPVLAGRDTLFVEVKLLEKVTNDTFLVRVLLKIKLYKIKSNNL